MLLEGKNAVVYGGGGKIGGAVARAFAREGATVHLAGRTAAPLDAVAGEIRAAGGAAGTATLDALDEAAVSAHADAVAARGGSLDISMNLISQQDVQGTPLAEMSLRRLRAAGAHHAADHLPDLPGGGAPHDQAAVRGDPDVRRLRGPGAAGGRVQVAFGALEALRRSLACELGPSGIRVLTLQTGGITETLPEGFPGRQAIVDGIESRTMLGRAATLADVGRVAAFAASDHARSMTATALNITCG